MTCRIFDTPHTVPHLEALRCGKDEKRGFSCGRNSSICQDNLKSTNLLHKRGLVNSQLIDTVTLSEKGMSVFRH